MAAHQSVNEILQAGRASGKSEEFIRAEMLRKGYTVEDSNGAFAREALELHHASTMSARDLTPTSRVVSPHPVDWLLLLFLGVSIGGGLILYFHGSFIREATTDAIASLTGDGFSLSEAPFIPFTTVPTREVEGDAPGPTSNFGSTRVSSSYVPETSSSGSQQSPPSTTPEPVASSAQPTVTLSASSRAVAAGSAVTLTWTSSHTEKCRSSSGFSTGSATSGTAEVRPLLSTSYTVTCTGASGTAKASVFVRTSPFEAPAGSTEPIVAVSPGIPPPPGIPVTPTPTPAPAPPPTDASTVANAAALTAALAKAKGGETIALAPGNYGNVDIRGKAFSSPVTVVSSVGGDPAVFRSLTVVSSTNLSFSKIAVRYTPDMTTLPHSPVVRIENATNISFANGTIQGGFAVNGVPESSPTGDATGNVIGYPTGYAVNITRSTNTVIRNNDISRTDRGLIVGIGNEGLRILNNTIHNLRRTAIAGNPGNNSVIDGNEIHSISPWRFGQTPVGDHADFIAFWMDSTPVSNVRITNNFMHPGTGPKDILGMWVVGTSEAAAYTNVTIKNNVLIHNNLQSIMLTTVRDSSIEHNTLLRTGTNVKQAPAVFLRAGTKRIAVTDNLTQTIIDNSGSTGADAITKTGNVLIQRDDPAKAYYYSPTVVEEAENMRDPSAIYTFVASRLANATAFNVGSSFSLLAGVAAGSAHLPDVSGVLIAFLKSYLGFL